jgi:hypothetical protein
MTHDEREAEAERLMAILQGEADPGIIDEHGILDRMPGPEAEQAECLLCHAYLDEDAEVIQGYTLCEDCIPEFRELIGLQIVCDICDGKRLIFHGPSQGWHACEMCEGRGWINGVVARWNGLI